MIESLVTHSNDLVCGPISYCVISYAHYQSSLLTLLMLRFQKLRIDKASDQIFARDHFSFLQFSSFTKRIIK